MLSYFHEYFLNKNGKKVLYAYSKPFNLKRCGDEWMTSEKELWELAGQLDDSPHYNIVPKENKKHIRKADTMERRAGKIVEWKN